MFDNKTSEERYMAVSAFLNKHKTAVITFTKKDGTVRELFGTLDNAYLPEKGQKDMENQVKLKDYETFTIWDLEADGWRAFKTANLIKVEAVA